MNDEPYKTPMSHKLTGLTIICAGVFAFVLIDYSGRLFIAFLFYHFAKWSGEMASKQFEIEKQERQNNP